jgi:hypothetical protein
VLLAYLFDQVRAFEGRGQLREDRLAQPLPARPVGETSFIEDERADVVAAGDEWKALELAGRADPDRNAGQTA